jgi:hypothetical protein
MSNAQGGGLPGQPQNFEVELPGGGKLQLATIDEVELFETSRDKYLHDYRITAQSDRLAIGNALLMHLENFRAQQRINGMEPELDPAGVPTGRYVKAKVSSQDRTAALNVLLKTSQEIREIEKSMGIDKKTRDQGGQYDVATYISAMKSGAREFGIHLSRRYKEYDRVCMEARVKLRMLENLDPEDLASENLSTDTFCDWMRGQLQVLEAADVKFAHEKGKMIVGRVR